MITQLVALNMTVCDAFASPFSLTRPHQLTMLQKQSSQLAGQPKSQQVAHTAYMLCTLMPFESGNQRTSLLYVAARYPDLSKETLTIISGLLKHGADVATITEVLQR